MPQLATRGHKDVSGLFFLQSFHVSQLSVKHVTPVAVVTVSQCQCRSATFSRPVVEHLSRRLFFEIMSLLPEKSNYREAERV